MRDQRNRAIIAIRAGCGLRRPDTTHLNVSHIQQLDDSWLTIDLYGKGWILFQPPVLMRDSAQLRQFEVRYAKVSCRGDVLQHRVDTVTYAVPLRSATGQCGCLGTKVVLRGRGAC